MVEKRNVTVDIRREVANVFVRIVEETIRTPDEVRDAVDADIVASAITRISIAAVLWRASKRTCSGCWRLRRRVCIARHCQRIGAESAVRIENSSARADLRRSLTGHTNPVIAGAGGGRKWEEAV